MKKKNTKETNEEKKGTEDCFHNSFDVGLFALENRFMDRTRDQPRQEPNKKREWWKNYKRDKKKKKKNMQNSKKKGC